MPLVTPVWPGNCIQKRVSLPDSGNLLRRDSLIRLYSPSSEFIAFYLLVAQASTKSMVNINKVRIYKPPRVGTLRGCILAVGKVSASIITAAVYPPGEGLWSPDCQASQGCPP